VLALVIIDLVMLQTFMAWSGLLSGIIILSFLILGQKTKQKGRFIKSMIFTIFAILIIIAGLAKSNQRAVIPVLLKVGLPNEMRVGIPVTYSIIKNSLKAGTKQILLGSGPATFGYDFAKFHSGGAISILSSNLYQGDGIIAESIPTIGVLTSVIVTLIIISFLVNALRLANSKKQSKLYLFGLFSASVVWLINALLGQVDAGTLFLGIIVLSLTTFFILENSKNKKTYYIINLRRFSLASFLGVILILGGVGLGVVSIAYASKFYSADKFLNQAINNQDIDKNIQNIKQAIRLNPQEGVYYTKLGQAYLIAANQKSGNSTKDNVNKVKKIIQKDITASLLFLNQGVKLMPKDVRALRSLALTYKFIGDTKSAEEVYQQLISLEPNGLGHYVSLGDLQLINLTEDKDDKLDRAIKFYKEAIKINPRAGEVYYKLAIVYSQKNDVDNALNNVARAVQLNSNNELYKFTLGIFLQNRGQEKDKANAEKIYRALLMINSQNIDVRIQLGSLYEQTNHLDEAKVEYKKVIEIIGDKREYQNIKQAMEKFIDNLNSGKLNIDKNNKVTVTDKETKNTREEMKKTDNKDGAETTTLNDQADTNQEKITTAQSSDEMITIAVDVEGPINVRSEGSLQGKKLTKIKTTGQFKKLQEKGAWVQIVIPAGDDNQQEIIGWVHSKFVVKK
jgi:tetratricopeptide (TPR) repeat protein